jgi:hypothetical protein
MQSTMGAPREVARPQSDDSYAHYVTVKHFLFHIRMLTSSHSSALFVHVIGDKHSSDSGTDTVHILLSEILKTEKIRKPKFFFMEVVCTPKLAFGPNMPRRDTRSTHTAHL